MMKINYYSLAAILLLCLIDISSQAKTIIGPPEKEDITIGFIKLTDMAPLAVAWERGYFLKEGLFVTLEAQANWKVLLDRVISGELDGGAMLAGQPVAATIGYGTQAHLVTAFSMGLNGNAITVSNKIWRAIKPQLPTDNQGKPRHPISAAALKPVISRYQKNGKAFRLGMVFPVSSHNYELRYWLAAGGINPGYYAPERGNTSGTLDADVQLTVTPPAQMPSTLYANTIEGYCVGEPWNQQAVQMGIGTALITDYEIWPNSPEKVFAVTDTFARANPNTHLHILRALMRAAYWLDKNHNANRAEATHILSRAYYVGADRDVIAKSMQGRFSYEKSDQRQLADFNVFFRYFATYPYPSDGIWYLTQMRRWGQINQYHPDSWYKKIARQVYRQKLYERAAQSLIDDGTLPKSAFPASSHNNFIRPYQGKFIDSVTFTPNQPNAYINRFAIGLKNKDRL